MKNATRTLPLNNIVVTPLAVALLASLGCDSNTSTDSTKPDQVTKTANVQKTLHLKVGGMTCQGCVNAIVSKIDKIDGVVSCDVSLEEQSATIALSNPDSAKSVEAAIRTLGYTVDPEAANPAS